MNKSFFFIFPLFFLFFLLLSFKGSSYFFSKNFFEISEFHFSPLNFGVNLSEVSELFLLMVFIVTSMVVLFGQMYMDHYNNKKFYFLTMSFLLSMVVLSLSSTGVIFMLGWDGLGLSSLFLIMFYPGKIPLFNSFMTFFFNRLGDCILIFILSCSLCDFHFFFFSILPSNIFIFFLLICAFTKSAQFPLSSWLPAAMSAPTPISAMVHSSTLVTAGIFLICNIQDYLNFSNCLILIFFISSLTFILGGLLGSMELDLKKIVAFSTMSQISMIIFFLVSGFQKIGLIHMFFHALFKTLLFCSCGLLFLSFFSNQNSKTFFLGSTAKSCSIFMIVSIYMMSGFYFSSSFFSKDSIIENFCTSFNLIFFFILVSGSIFTIFYSCKILSVFGNLNPLFPAPFVSKKLLFPFFWIFSIMVIFSPFMIQSFIFMSETPILSLFEISLISLILILALFVILKVNNFYFFFSSEIFMSKFFSFSMGGKMMVLDNFSLFFSDQFMFKPFTLKKLGSMNSLNFLNPFIFSMILLFILW